MKQPVYALPLFDMLLHAIHVHRRDHQGLYPRRIEIHPANFETLRQDPRTHETLMYSNARDVQNFRGVPLVIDVQAVRLKMITADNMVEYL